MRKDKTDRNKKILVFFIAFVMIGSTFGVIFFGYNQQANKARYNNFVFVQRDGWWSVRINNREVFFNYLPNDIADINFEDNVQSRLNSVVEIDITSEINSTFKEDIALAEQYIYDVLSSFNIYVRNGFTTENKFNKQVITCENATLNVPVVYFKESNETKVYLQDDCIIAESASNINFLKIKDRLLYNILGIMK